MTKKKVVKKKTSKKPLNNEEPKSIYLEPNEAFRLELLSLEKQVHDERSKVIQRDKVILELKYHSQLRDLADRLKSVQDDKKSAHERYAAEVDLVRHRLGIEGSFGFDPESLEIVLDDAPSQEE